MSTPGSLRQRIRRSVRSEAPLAQVKQPPPFEMVRAARRAVLGRGERNHAAEDAPLAGEVLHFDPPAAGIDGLLTDYQAESKPAAVASATRRLHRARTGARSPTAASRAGWHTHLAHFDVPSRASCQTASITATRRPPASRAEPKRTCGC